MPEPPESLPATEPALQTPGRFAAGPESGPPIALPPRRDPPSVFVGPNGIRAGWSVLIFIAIVVALVFCVSLAVKFLLHPKPPTPGAPMPVWLGIANEGVQFLIVVIATWIMSRIERKPALSYGYQGRARGARFLWGLAWGFAAISVVVLALDKLGYLSLDGRALNGAIAWRYALLWGVAFLLVGFFEESMLRGYLQSTLARGLGFWWAALILSFLFGFGHGHNPGESPVGLFSAGAIGLVFCLSLWYTGSLWWAVGFHAAWDWGESYFYGTADSGWVVQGHLYNEHPVGKLLWSGGLTGPEGSLIIVPVIILIALLMVLWWGRRERSPFAGGGWRPKRIPATPEVPTTAVTGLAGS